MSRHFIGRCKGCKAAVRLTLDVRTVQKAESFWSESVRRQVHRPGRYEVTVPTGATVRVEGGAFWLTCLCGRGVEFRAINGRRSEKKCGARCLSATGHDCECSCAGANHGAGHAA